MNNLSFAWLSEQIVKENSDAVMFADHEGFIRLWNKGAEAMFGYSAAEVEGKSLDLIIPENLRNRHWEGYHKVMASGVTRYGTELLAAPGIRKDGSRLSLEFSMVIVRGEDGAVLGTRCHHARYNGALQKGEGTQGADQGSGGGRDAVSWNSAGKRKRPPA